MEGRKRALDGKWADLHPSAGRIWPAGHMFYTPGLEDVWERLSSKLHQRTKKRRKERKERKKERRRRSSGSLLEFISGFRVRMGSVERQEH